MFWPAQSNRSKNSRSVPLRRFAIELMVSRSARSIGAHGDENQAKVSYSTHEGRERLLADIAEAADHLALSVAALGEAYEELDEQTADHLEEELFRPAQAAYGRLRRIHAEFAERYRLPARTFDRSSGGMHAGHPRVYVERAVEGIERADEVISE